MYSYICVCIHTAIALFSSNWNYFFWKQYPKPPFIPVCLQSGYPKSHGLNSHFPHPHEIAVIWGTHAPCSGKIHTHPYSYHTQFIPISPVWSTISYGLPWLFGEFSCGDPVINWSTSGPRHPQAVPSAPCSCPSAPPSFESSETWPKKRYFFICTHIMYSIYI